MENNYEKYALIKMQIANLETQADEIKETIIADMKEKGKLKDDESTPLGVFTLQTRKTWKYTPATQALAEDLKVAQIQEQETEEATYTESTSLVFKTIKI